ncbi:hypothetical protein ACKTEK_01805 [Tepidamorphus sp. 3E244]|uniref:hypothetical protein n=1 Tax=Tepidamorphus sp. 3E244 TaxID=3385498 RepID=UPI0038FCAE57
MSESENKTDASAEPSELAEPKDGFTPDEAFRKKRRSRNIAIALTLVGMMILFYVVTIVKMTANYGS